MAESVRALCTENSSERQQPPPHHELAHVVESANAAIIGLTLNGTVVSWNGGAEKLYGYTASEMAGRPVSVLNSPHRPADLAEGLNKLREAQAATSFDTVHLRKDGKPAEVLLSISPIQGMDGRIIGASLVCVDIANRKQEEKERLELIRELTNALSRMNRLKREETYQD